MDYQALPPVDLHLLPEPDVAVPPLLAAVKALRPTAPALPAAPARQSPPALSTLDTAKVIEVPMMAAALKEALGGAEACVIRVPLRWGGPLGHFHHPPGLPGGAGRRRRWA